MNLIHGIIAILTLTNISFGTPFKPVTSTASIVSKLTSTQKRTLIHPTFCQGFAQQFKTEHHDLLPLNGLALYHSPTLKNFYTYAPDSPTRQLTKLLFCPLNNTLHHTHYTSHVPFSLTPELCGRLLGLIKNKELFQPDSNKRNKLAAAIKDNHQQELEKLNLQSNVSWEKINHFFDLIHQSYNECKQPGIYDPHTPTAILLAFMCCKSNNLKDITAWSNALIKEAPHITTYSNQKNFDTEALTIKKNNKGEAQIVHLNHEKSLLTLLENKLARHNIAPTMQTTTISFQGQSMQNCLEAAIFDMLSSMLYNPHTEKFDIATINPAIQIKPVFKCFLQALDPQCASQYQAAASWAHLLSNLPISRIYKHNNCQIINDINAVLKIFNYIFNTHALSFEELGRQLSSPTTKIFLNPKRNIKHYPTNNTLNIAIQTLPSNFKKGRMKFTDHFTEFYAQGASSYEDYETDHSLHGPDTVKACEYHLSKNLSPQQYAIPLTYMLPLMNTTHIQFHLKNQHYLGARYLSHKLELPHERQNILKKAKTQNTAFSKAYEKLLHNLKSS